ncbi:hypothetical protein [Streptomyces sp. NPDC047985]|uniref:hypothetical protein n=1 Tax=Streptomyces sp. NPDC047985 TaxID=3155384 RepID=UPI00341A2068
MTTTVPTDDDVKALYSFIMQRADEEWAAINGDEALHATHPDAAARFYRVSNSNKLAVTSTRRCLADLLDRGDDKLAELIWHLLTAAGEEWKDHPDYLPRWENHQRAEIRRQLAG